MPQDNEDKRQGAGAPTDIPEDTAIQAYRRAFARSGGVGRAKALSDDKRAAIARAGGLASGVTRRLQAAARRAAADMGAPRAHIAIIKPKKPGKGSSKTP